MGNQGSGMLSDVPKAVQDSYSVLSGGKGPRFFLTHPAILESSSFLQETFEGTTLPGDQREKPLGCHPTQCAVTWPQHTPPAPRRDSPAPPASLRWPGPARPSAAPQHTDTRAPCTLCESYVAPSLKPVCKCSEGGQRPPSAAYQQARTGSPHGHC